MQDPPRRSLRGRCHTQGSWDTYGNPTPATRLTLCLLWSNPQNVTVRFLPISRSSWTLQLRSRRCEYPWAMRHHSWSSRRRCLTQHHLVRAVPWTQCVYPASHILAVHSRHRYHQAEDRHCFQLNPALANTKSHMRMQTTRLQRHRYATDLNVK